MNHRRADLLLIIHLTRQFLRTKYRMQLVVVSC